MADTPVRARHAGWLVLQTMLVLVIPAAVCAGVSLLEARRLTATQADIAARVLVHQAEAISGYAWRVLGEVQPLARRPCAVAEPRLQYLGSRSPYLRSLFFARGDVVLCSSGLGGGPQRLSDLLPALRLPAPGRATIAVPDLHNEQARPAVAFVEDWGGVSVVAVVDGQYLADLLNTVADLRSYDVEMRFGTGMPIRSQPRTGDGRAGGMAQVRTRHSQDGSVRVAITVPDRDVYATWRRVAMQFVPAALVLGAVLGFAGWRLQLRQSSPVESLRRAMRRGEFHLCYQPIYDMAAGRCMGVEALMRWQRADGSEVRPDVFIAQAETHGMIVPLTLHMFQLVQRDVARWPVPPGFHVDVNISAEHLTRQDLVEHVRMLRRGVAATGALIVLEITERSLVSDDMQARHNLEVLRGEGTRVAIDDFGVGNCSLSYLQRFPVDYLKIDRGFVSAIESVEGEAPVLDAIVSLAGRLGLRVIAEGVETPVQLEYLRARDVAYVQGYLYDRPMPAGELAQWLRRNGTRPLRV